LNSYNRALQLEPNYAFAWSNKGYVLKNQGKYGEALACYDKAIELDPEDSFTLTQRARAIKAQAKTNQLSPAKIGLLSMNKKRKYNKISEKEIEELKTQAKSWYFI